MSCAMPTDYDEAMARQMLARMLRSNATRRRIGEAATPSGLTTDLSVAVVETRVPPNIFSTAERAGEQRAAHHRAAAVCRRATTNHDDVSVVGGRCRR